MTVNLKSFIRTYLAICIALSAIAIYQTEEQTRALTRIASRYKWAVLIGVFALNVIVGIFVYVSPQKIFPFLENSEFKKPPARALKILGIVLIFAGFPFLWYVKFYFFGKALTALFPLLWVMWGAASIQAVILKRITRFSWPAVFMAALLLNGIVFQIYAIFQPVTDYPFSLGWSEASRFYYGSLPFSQSIYGVKLPLSIWHGTRYFLLSIPFLIKGLPLWADRLWQAILWLGLTALTSWSLIRRIKVQDRITNWILGGWFFLFLFQGAVYYQLQVMVAIILLGVSVRRPWRSLIAVLAASFWAGMSRLNWYPVPAMLAIALYLLEEPFSRQNHFWRYIARPALWAALGLITALLGQAFYIAISGNADVSGFTSSLRSPLLWYRWFPSDTNPLGIIPGILIVSLPLFALLFWTLRGRLNNLHFVRSSGLALMLLALFGGGLVVSAKIGGGGDLHNMDAYMIMLALIAVYFMTQRVETESAGRSAFAGLGRQDKEAAAWPLITLMLIVPVAFSLSRIVPPISYDRAQAQKDLSALSKTVQSYSKSGEVLFMYERHLLTFDMIPNVPLTKDYEVIALMEMAISGNQPYLDKFYSDLKNHRFAAIVARKQNLDANSGDFAEESALWNKLVAYPLLCEYEPTLTLESSNIQVFVPRAVPECPLPSPANRQP
ncbi:MAG: hypothetical protein HYR93_09575 [Chloroflexi bacterium]|nr:hypothetical protein [Chloroflexota bacterium]